MCQREDEMRQIKQYINERIKIVSLSFKGVKRDEKLIDIADILKQYSRVDIIPEIQKFKFFDFEYAREQTRNSHIYRISHIPAEELTNEINRINNLERVFEEFREFLRFMRYRSEEIEEQYICGSFCGFKVMYRDNLEIIERIRDEIDDRKFNINRIGLRQAIELCKSNFIAMIRAEMALYRMEESESLQNEIAKKFKFIDNIDQYIDEINLELKVIADISDEILCSENLVNELRNLDLNDEDRQMIERYYTLSGIG